MNKQILYFSPVQTSFVDADIRMLSANYKVRSFILNAGKGIKLMQRLFEQLLFLLKHGKNASVYLCHFAGYSSLLPVLFGKFFKKSVFIIIAGTDAAKFEEFKYGNYTKKLYSIATKISILNATKLLPVHESMVMQEYKYYDGGKPMQGYGYFIKKAIRIPYETIYYGYDSDFFKPYEGACRVLNSFITVGNYSDERVFFRKGFDVIIELAKLFPEKSFTFVGGASLINVNFPSNVVLKGRMTQGELIEEFSRHEFYFQLSIMEGFPNALAEAMLCKCIPIGSAVSGIPTIIGDTGYILQEKNLDHLGKLVKYALYDERRGILPSLARERVAKNFTEQRRLSKMIHEIEAYGNT